MNDSKAHQTLWLEANLSCRQACSGTTEEVKATNQAFAAEKKDKRMTLLLKKKIRQASSCFLELLTANAAMHATVDRWYLNPQMLLHEKGDCCVVIVMSHAYLVPRLQ